MLGFVQDALDPEKSDAFLDNFLPFQAQVAALGVQNSLVQTALKLTVPGMPDIYQGAELWDFSLVDPDNRRPVDFAAREKLLAELDGALARDRRATIRRLLADWQDGGVKLALTMLILRYRRDHPALFSDGSYEPLDVTGADADRVCAFLRRQGDETLVVAVRRFPARHGNDATVVLPPGNWTNLLTGASAGQDLFSDLPVAVLVPS